MNMSAAALRRFSPHAARPPRAADVFELRDRSALSPRRSNAMRAIAFAHVPQCAGECAVL